MGVSADRSFFVVDPDANLEKTREVVLPALKALGITQGLVGPKPLKVTVVLHDALI